MREEDIQFGQKAMALGLLDKKKLDFCQEIQKNLPQNQYISLANICLKKNFLTIAQIEMVLQSTNSVQVASHAETITGQPTEMPVAKAGTELLETTKKQKNFGRYVILGEVGRGGMGCVYKAFDPKLGRAVALKMLITGDTASDQEKQRFLREAKATAKLRHPNIVTVYNLGQEQGAYYFTMDLIEGSSLAHILKKRTLSGKQTASVMLKIVAAVHYAHTKGIIHRDLKPGNVMMENNAIPKVMDFGLAKVINDSAKLSKSGMIMGTLQYMAPEQAEGRIRSIDRRSDVYSLGIMLYELLCGKLPFDGDNSFQIIHKLLNEDPIPPTKIKATVPIALQNICMKAIEKKKEQRYNSAGEMAKDLQNYLKGEDVSAKGVSSTQITLRKIKKHRYSLISLLSISLSIIFVCFFTLNKKTQIVETKKEPVKKKIAQKTPPMNFSCSIIEQNGYKKNKFLHGEKVFLEISWEEMPEKPVMVTIFGTGIKTYQKEYSEKRRKSILECILSPSPGQKEYKITIQLSSDKVLRSKQLNFYVEKEKEKETTLIPENILTLPDDSLVKWAALKKYSQKYAGKPAEKKIDRIMTQIEQNWLNKLEEERQVIKIMKKKKEYDALLELDFSLKIPLRHRAILFRMGEKNQQIENSIRSLRREYQEGQEKAIKGLAVSEQQSEHDKEREKWQKKHDEFFLDIFPHLLRSKDFQQIYKDLAALKKQGQKYEEIGFVKEAHYATKKIEIMLKQLDSILLPRIRQFMSIKTIDKKFYQGQLVSIQRQKGIVLLNSSKKAIPIVYTRFSAHSLRNFTDKKKVSEYLYCLGVLSLEEFPENASKYFQMAEKKGYTRMDFAKNWQKLKEKRREDVEKKQEAPAEISNDGEIPQEWPKHLWKVCWKGQYVDFTTKEWNELDHREQFFLAKKYQEWYAQKKGVEVEKKIFYRKIPFILVLIPPGSYWRGSNEVKYGSPVTRVTIKPFWASKYEVTCAQWQTVYSKKKNHKITKRDTRQPRNEVTWIMANDFCQASNSVTGFNLLSEAQWEYACRAGVTTPYYWGEKTDDRYCWTNENSKNFKAVGKTLPNAFGLYDMSGNLLEWCRDEWHDNYEKAPTNGDAFLCPKEENSVLRGGSFAGKSNKCRSAYRDFDEKEIGEEDYGFRIKMPFK